VLLKVAIVLGSLVLTVAPAFADTILTFNITGIADHQDINQAYGDRVAAGVDLVGTYGTTDSTYTPNVVVAYGAPGEDPALWTSGYGDLTNIYFNDADGDTTFTTRFTADPGFLVNLMSFDIASFIDAGQTIAGAEARDVATSALLWSIGQTDVTGSTHLMLSPNAIANDVRLVINLTGLGSVSDDIGIDNVRFAQQLADTTAIPEPATLSLFGLGLAALGANRKRRASAKLQ
jgi:hypothetical protein